MFIVHGLGEHCHRYDRIVEFLNRQKIRVYSFDHRGHGRTHHLPPSPHPRRLQGHKGHIDADKRVVMQDIQQLLGRAREDGIREEVPKYLLGHSLGGLMVIYYVLTEEIGRLSGLITIGTECRVQRFNTMCAFTFI